MRRDAAHRWLGPGRHRYAYRGPLGGGHDQSHPTLAGIATESEYQEKSHKCVQPSDPRLVWRFADLYPARFGPHQNPVALGPERMPYRQYLLL